MALFPNVPNVPGVPQVLRNLTAIPSPSPLAFSDFSPDFENDRPVWGIFKDGESVVDVDSVQSLEYRNDWDISDYPLEKGAFETYNKVPSPFGVKIRLASGSTQDKREAFLSQLTTIAGSMDKYDVMTPERTYTSVNIEHIDYRRSNQSGVGMIMADVWLLEIREKAKTSFTKVESPTSADPQSNGTIQTSTPTDGQKAKASAVQ